MFKKYEFLRFYMVLACLYFCGCSIEASITDLNTLVDTPDIINKQQRISPDLTSAEVVTSSNDVVVSGVFGETVDFVTTPNNTTIKGVFYY